MATYQNIGDIYDEIDAVRARLMARAESLTPEQAAFRPQPESWTPAELLEHLSLTESGICRMFEIMLSRPGVADAGNGFQPFSLDELAAQAAGRMFQAPERIAPQGKTTLAASLESLKQSRAAMHALRPRIEAADLSQQTMPHPAFGPINGYQWLAFLGAHEARHAAQLKRILGG